MNSRSNFEFLLALQRQNFQPNLSIVNTKDRNKVNEMYSYQTVVDENVFILIFLTPTQYTRP